MLGDDPKSILDLCRSSDRISPLKVAIMSSRTPEAIMSRCLELMTLWRSNLWPVDGPETDRSGRMVQSSLEPDELDRRAETETGGADVRAPAAVGLQLDEVRRVYVEHEKLPLRVCWGGFQLDETVLSTVIDGFHRSHRYQVVSDAVACRRPGVGDVASYKQAVVKVISNYAGVLDSSELVEASNGMTEDASRCVSPTSQPFGQFDEHARSALILNAMTSRKPSATVRSI